MRNGRKNRKERREESRRRNCEMETGEFRVTERERERGRLSEDQFWGRIVLVQRQKKGETI